MHPLSTAPPAGVKKPEAATQQRCIRKRRPWAALLSTDLSIALHHKAIKSVVRAPNDALLPAGLLERHPPWPWQWRYWPAALLQICRCFNPGLIHTIMLLGSQFPSRRCIAGLPRQTPPTGGGTRPHEPPPKSSRAESPWGVPALNDLGADAAGQRPARHLRSNLCSHRLVSFNRHHRANAISIKGIDRITKAP